ncbi:MAG: ABC transporter permease [Calditrichales bacterium]|nr:MAG: ABC transporter permease [Calditrichales bacterium]
MNGLNQASNRFAPLKRISSISRKEFLHIVHDPRSLIIIFVMPVLQLIMFGYALNMEIQSTDLAVRDFSQTTASRELIQQFSGSAHFNVFPYSGSLDDIDHLFINREARAVLIIDKDFHRRQQQEITTPVQLIVDAADPNAATMTKQYCTNLIMLYNTNRTAGKITLPFDIQPRIWYNPDLKSAYFFIPGLVALILVMISALLTSITITREKEMGTLEQILVSPVKPAEIIFGKVLPYIAMAFFDGILILVLGIILFQVPFIGSYLLLLLLSVLYIITALSLGLMISTLVSTQQVAMMIAIAVTLLPTLMLSGFIFPLKSMPILLQYISYIVPAKYYLIIIRGIMLKGNTLSQLAVQSLFLLFITVLLLTNSIRRFKINLEK